MSIGHSVGVAGRNRNSDVRTVQELLNHRMPLSAPLLDVDGIVGPKTIAAIRRFERAALGSTQPTGQVVPRGPVMQALTANPSSPPRKIAPPAAVAPPRPVALPKGFAQNEAALREELAKENALWWADFRKDVEDTTTKWAQLFVVFDRVVDARRLAQVWMVLRGAGEPPKEIARVAGILLGIAKEDEVFCKSIVKFISDVKGTTLFPTICKYLEKSGKVVVFLDFTTRYYNNWKNGDWHMAWVDIYKTWIGEAVPIAAIIDGLEGLAASLGGERFKKKGHFFRYLRVINLPGLGANAVDVLGVAIHSAVTREIDLARFKRLEDRVRNSPAQVFVEIGDDLADALIKFADMPKKEFDEMMTVTNVRNWLRYLVTSKMPGE